MKTTPKSGQKADRLPVGKFLAWKSRDVSMSIVSVIILGYLMVFCTDYMNMDAALVGALLMASRIFGVTDLFAGFIVDNTNTRWGKARPYEICIVFEWAATIALFFCSPEWSLVLKAVWVFAMYTCVYAIFNTMLTANGTPYTIRVFKTRALIAKVSSYGGILSMVAAMAVSVVFPIAMQALVVEERGGWRALVLIFAIPLAVIGMFRFIFVKEDVNVDVGQKEERIKVKQVLKMLAVNKYGWAFAGIMGLYNLIVGVAVTTYYFKWIVGNISIMGVFSAVSIITLPLMVAFPKLIKKYTVSNLIQPELRKILAHTVFLR